MTTMVKKYCRWCGEAIHPKKIFCCTACRREEKREEDEGKIRARSKLREMEKRHAKEDAEFRKSKTAAYTTNTLFEAELISRVDDMRKIVYDNKHE